MKQKIEYIAVIRNWWDKQNGNSYFSAQVFDIHMRLIKVLPFQYGSDSEHSIVSWVQAMNPIHEHIHDVRRKIYFDRNDTTKRDCVALGKAIVEGDEQ